MKFKITLNNGTHTVEESDHEVDVIPTLMSAALVATAVLMTNGKGADNVTVTKYESDGTLAEDYFFYAEKD